MMPPIITRAKSGRPLVLSGRPVAINVALPEDQRAALSRAALRRGTTAAELVRALIRALLADDAAAGVE